MHPGTVLIGAGLLLLLHAGYSAAHYRQFLVPLEGEAAPTGDKPPLDAVLETLAGLALCVIGVVSTAGKLLPVRGSAGGGRTVDAKETAADFALFNHRGIALRRRIEALRRSQH